jgi:hypothetical protein
VEIPRYTRDGADNVHRLPLHTGLVYRRISPSCSPMWRRL